MHVIGNRSVNINKQQDKMMDYTMLKFLCFVVHIFKNKNNCCPGQEKLSRLALPTLLAYPGALAEPLVEWGGEIFLGRNQGDKIQECCFC